MASKDCSNYYQDFLKAFKAAHPSLKGIQIQERVNSKWSTLKTEIKGETMATQRLNIVVAACNNMGIGIEGRIPWRIKKDMAFFKKISTTTVQEGKQNVVIMGKKTWFSIPAKFRPLPDRMNIVLSSQLTESPEGAHLARSLPEALSMVNDNVDCGGIFVIGGSSLYREAMSAPNPCKIYFTRVLGDFECDVFFPEIDLSVFEKTDNPEEIPSQDQEENGIKFRFEVYDKNNV